MLGCDMSFTLAALNPASAETRAGSKSLFFLEDDPTRRKKKKGFARLCEEKLHKGGV